MCGGRCSAIAGWSGAPRGTAALPPSQPTFAGRRSSAGIYAAAAHATCYIGHTWTRIDGIAGGFFLRVSLSVGDIEGGEELKGG